MAGLLPGPVKGEQGCPHGPGNLGLCRYGDIDPTELLPNLGYHPHVLAYASRDHELVRDSYRFQQLHHPSGDRLVQPGQNVGLAHPLLHQRCRLALDKDRADRTEGDFLRALERKLANLKQGHLQGVRDDLQEAPGAGRTLVVDDEVLHFAPLV